MRHAGGVLVCPRCGIPLGGTEHELGIAWRCGACRGQSLNFSQFRRMVPEHGARDIWLEAMKRPVTPQQRTRCPECLAAMDAVLIPLNGRTIELDICLLCQRLWLDAQEENGVANPPGKSGKPFSLGTGKGPNTADAETVLTVMRRRERRAKASPDLRWISRCLVESLIAAGVAWVEIGVISGTRFADLLDFRDPIRIRLAIVAGAVWFVLRMLLKR